METQEDYQYRVVSDNIVTAVLIMSRAGDNELYTFVGNLDEDTIKRKVFDKSPEWWGTPDNVEIVDFQIIEFLKFGN